MKLEIVSHLRNTVLINTRIPLVHFIIIIIVFLFFLSVFFVFWGGGGRGEGGGAYSRSVT